ncbi:MAG: type II toxin-antitoxin system PemK/MazF family toxin [Candidatus Thioglobus sp.]|nr:type II toxin-antitoxin system PemK/MazF family toxin [Candidatus Thioglobus sp.]
MVRRGEVYWVNLDPTFGSEIKKTRPCLVVSPNVLNKQVPRVLIAPLTSKGASLPSRVIVDFNQKTAKILLDQIRSIDKKRLQQKIGVIPLSIWQPTLIEMFS